MTRVSRTTKFVVGGSLAALVLVGCGSDAAPSDTAAATTPEPTTTPEAEASPTSSPTPTPEPEPAVAGLIYLPEQPPTFETPS